MTADERRVHGRVSLEHPATLIADGSRHAATLVQLSRTGAQLTVDRRVAEPGQRVDLELEAPGGDAPVRLSCRVVHAESEAEKVRIGLERTEATDADPPALDRLMTELLGGPGGGARRYARVSRRIEVQCQTAEETRAVMCDLSQGGLSIESPHPLSVDEPITVTVELPGFESQLQLQGTVVHVRRLDDERYHAGVRFEDLAPERKGVLRDLMQFLVRGSSGESGGGSGGGGPG